MNRSLASTAVQTQSNSLLATLNLLQPKAAKVGLDLTDDQTASNNQPATPLLALVDEARVLLGWSQKQMALNAAVIASIEACMEANEQCAAITKSLKESEDTRGNRYGEHAKFKAELLTAITAKAGRRPV